MAQNKNSSNTKNKSTGKTNTGRSSSGDRYQQQTLEDEVQRGLVKEIWFWVFLAIMLALFLCNFGILGFVGDAISGFLFGVFGLMAYVAPIVIAAFVLLFSANRGNGSAMRKLIGVLLLFLVLAMIFDLAAGDAISLDKYDLKQIYQNCHDNRNGGGFLAGSVVYLLHAGIDTVGTVLIMILLTVIAGILLTERSLKKLLKNYKDSLQERTVQGYDEWQEHRRSEREIRAREKEEREARGERLTATVREQLEDRSLGGGELQEEDTEEKHPKLPTPPIRQVLTDKRNQNLQGDSETAPVPTQQKKSQKEMQEQKALEREELRRRKIEERENNSILVSVPEVASDSDYPFERRVKHTDEVHELHFGDAVSPSESDSYEEEVPSSYDEAYVEESADLAEESDRFDFERIPVRNDHAVTVSYDAGYGEAAEEDRSIISSATDSDSSSEEIKQVYYGGRMHEVKASDAEPSAPTVHTENPVVLEDPDKNVVPIRQRERSSASLAGSHPGDVKMEKAPEKSAAAPAKKPAPLSNKPYQFPPLNLLNPGKKNGGSSQAELQETAARLQEVLASFGVNVTMEDISQGPTVTRYEMKPDQGVKVSKIVGLADDIKLNLAAADIRIEAPIPGKAAVGIEVPNKENSMVALRDLLESKEFKEFPSKIAFGVGKDIAGQVVVNDIGKMPHVLIAGATGSGKSVCINTLIMSILYKATPEEVGLVMIDPKVVELSVYNGIPHLLIPVVTDPRKATAALQWAVKEMELRYRKFADFNVRDLKGYNAKVDEWRGGPDEEKPYRMPQLVIIIDELADLMMVCPGDVEEAICRLAQLARAAGIHLVVATQRPSVDVITGLIKANMPSRIAFAVSSGTDSRTILDSVGAEKLLGKGDMLFYPQGYTKPARLQGAFVSDEEVGAVVDFLKNQRLQNTRYADMVAESVNSAAEASSSETASGDSTDSDGRDEYFAEAGRCIITSGKASIGYLQRCLKIGFNRAARIMDSLADYGVVGPEASTKSREILMTIEEFESFLQDLNG